MELRETGLAGDCCIRKMLEAGQEDRHGLLEGWEPLLTEHSLGSCELQGIVAAAAGEGALLTARCSRSACL